VKVSNKFIQLSAALFASTFAVAAFMSGSAMAQGIYSCVDEKGRKLTSDRPIAECMDRAQKEMNPSGTVRRVITPPPSAKDRAELAEKEKQDAEARLQQVEEKRRDRELLSRYPSRASHDKERSTALEQPTELSAAATKRSQDLAEQRKGIVSELEFYKSSPGKAPPALKRRLDETDSNMADQKRIAAEQEAEKKRINQRFDAEAAKLKPQWSMPGAAEASASPKKP
jgi:Domain of unknown function (DUF4124)